MIIARWGMLLVAAVLIVIAQGEASADLPFSTQQVVAASVIGLLAPLFWPGLAATPARTAARVLMWSAAAAGAVMVVMRIGGPSSQPLTRSLGVCALLGLILILTHSLTALLERHLRGRSIEAREAREAASRTAVVVLALWGALPLWLGPIAELLTARAGGAIDAVIGLSPLTHLAVASDNDLLRNEWFYQRSNLAGLPFSYPDLATVAWSYAVLCTALLALLARRARLAVAGAQCNPIRTEEAS